MTLGSASLIAALYLGLAPRVAKGIYRNMLFRPHPYPEGDYDSKSIAGVHYEDVFFNSIDGTRLHGWFFDQPKSSFVVLMSHGNTGNIAGRPALLESILKTGASMLVYDYRGYGRSSGLPSVDGVIDDACAAYDYLVNERNINPENIIFYGESIGAAITCQLSTKRKPKGMILQSGFSCITKISRHHIPFMHVYPAALFPQPLLDSVSVLKQEHPPLLIVHGHKDIVVPMSHARELYASAIGRKLLADFPEAGHSDIPILAQDRFVGVMREFVKELGLR